MKDLNQAKLNENGKAPSDTYKNPLHQSQPFNPYGYYMPQPYNNRLMDLQKNYDASRKDKGKAGQVQYF